MRITFTHLRLIRMRDLNMLMINAEVLGGAIDIRDASRLALELALKLDVAVSFDFNGIPLLALPSYSVEEVVSQYRYRSTEYNDAGSGI